MAPGDVLVTNTPWIATGHLNDITVAKPIFRKGRIVAFAASTAHAPDIGGKVRSVEPREVFEEGFHIPVMKFIDAGQPDRTFLKLLRAAVRTPDQTEGDLWAQITGLDLLERRLGELMTRVRPRRPRGLRRRDPGTLRAGHARRHPRAARRHLHPHLPDRRAGGALHLQHRRQGRGRAHLRRLRRHLRPSRSRHQLHDDLHLRHDGLCAEMRAAAEPAQQRGHLPLHRGGGAGGLHRQPPLPRRRRRAHGDGPLSALRRVRRAGARAPRPHHRRLRLAAVEHDPDGRARQRRDLRQRALLQRRHGRHRQQRRPEHLRLAQQRLQRPRRADRAQQRAVRAQEGAAPGQRRRGPVPRRPRPGDRVRGHVRHARRHHLHGRALPLPGTRHAGRAGRRPRRGAHRRRRTSTTARMFCSGRGSGSRCSTPGGGGMGPPRGARCGRRSSRIGAKGIRCRAQ